jgi:hypothetical protein
MNGRFGRTALLFLLLAIGVGVLSYTAGVSHGLAIAPAVGAPSTGAVPYAYYRPWGWGWGFAPLFFLGFWFFMFAVFRGFFWGGTYRRCGYGPGWREQRVDDWHRHAHEEMNKKP